MKRALVASLAGALLVGCAALGLGAPEDPAKVAADARKASVAACRAYRQAVALGLPPRGDADAACRSVQGLCDE